MSAKCVCRQCREEFAAPKRKRMPAFCSVTCRDKSLQGVMGDPGVRRMDRCEQCSREFPIYHWQPNSAKIRKFCTPQCYHRSLVKELKRCGGCGVEISRERKYCSKRCANRMSMLARRGKRMGGRKASPGVEHVCARCGGLFVARPAQRRKFCGVACSIEGRVQVPTVKTGWPETVEARAMSVSEARAGGFRALTSGFLPYEAEALLREEKSSAARGLRVVIVRVGEERQLWRAGGAAGSANTPKQQRVCAGEFERIGEALLEVFADGRRAAVATKRHF